uniref:neuromedin Ba n=1 Tax=Monopterus albus TaxID=43700 RepID=UPI0009B36023|nr:bombesin-like [Monopterus albus]
MKGTLTKICRARLLASFILIVCITMTSSKTRDITELRNKVSKNKVNSRGNLWATGHFMGKKSVVDRSFMESTSEGTLTEVRSGGHRQEDLQAALIQVLQTVEQTQRKRVLEIGGRDRA